jgi:hypothetical protein
MQKPAVPALVVVPGDAHLDFRALFAIATAYAHAGLIVSEHGHRNERIEFTFPAVICSSFALELFLKFFLMVDRAERGITERQLDFGHSVPDLWRKVTPPHKALIAGSFRNASGTPHMDAPELRMELFEKALAGLGDKPFVQWRYVHELQEVAFMSHGAITVVVDALGYAAQFVMKTKTEKMRKDNSST